MKAFRAFAAYGILCILIVSGCGGQPPQSPKLTKDVVQELGEKRANIQEYEERLGPGVKVQNPANRPPNVQAFRWIQWTNQGLTLTVGVTEKGEVLSASIVDMPN